MHTCMHTYIHVRTYVRTCIHTYIDRGPCQPMEWFGEKAWVSPSRGQQSSIGNYCKFNSGIQYCKPTRMLVRGGHIQDINENNGCGPGGWAHPDWDTSCFRIRWSAFVEHWVWTFRTCKCSWLSDYIPLSPGYTSLNCLFYTPSIPHPRNTSPSLMVYLLYGSFPMYKPMCKQSWASSIALFISCCHWSSHCFLLWSSIFLLCCSATFACMQPMFLHTSSSSWHSLRSALRTRL